MELKNDDLLIRPLLGLTNSIYVVLLFTVKFCFVKRLLDY